MKFKYKYIHVRWGIFSFGRIRQFKPIRQDNLGNLGKIDKLLSLNVGNVNSPARRLMTID